MESNNHMNNRKDVFSGTVGGGLYSDTDSRMIDRKRKEDDGSFSFHDAMLQIEMIFQSSLLSYGFKEYSIENFVDKKYFYSWKGKEGCSDTDAMRQGLDIDRILEKENPSINEVLTYLQYTLNIAELCRRNYNSDELTGYYFDLRSYTTLLTRIRELLTRLKYDVKYIADKEVIYLVTKDVAADAVSNTSEDPITDAIVEYNSYSVAGNLDRKRKILNNMGDMVESYTDNLSPGNVKLFSNIEFMLYNFNIRNNNLDGDDKVDHVAAMSKEELEAWYDETYQMLLLRILQQENLERMRRVEAVQQACEATSVESFSKNLDREGVQRVLSRRRVEDMNFVAQSVAEAATVSNQSYAAEKKILSDKEKKAEEKVRRAEEKARESMRAVREKELAEIAKADLDKDVNAILAENEEEKPAKPAKETESRKTSRKSKGYTPSFRDVSDTASTAVSHETDNSASFVKKSADSETEKWDKEYSSRKKAWAEGDESEEEKSKEGTANVGTEKKPRNWIRILLTGGVILLAAFLAGAVSLVHFNYARSDYVSDKQIPINTDKEMIDTYASDTEIEDASAMTIREDAQHQITAAATKIDGSAMLNILIACADNVGSQTYAPADAIAVVSFNKSTKRLTTVSLLSNLYADTENAGTIKLGDVTLYAGMPALVSVVEDTYGIPLDGYAWTDYRGMIKIIDRLGGIDAVITEAEMRIANVYINQMAEAFGEEAASHQLRMTGDVHLDGYQAVAYSRIGESNEADYAKAARQRTVLNSIAGAYAEAGFGEKTSIMREILPNITHNISESQVFSNLSVISAAKSYAKAGFTLPLEGHYKMEGILAVPDFAETLPILKQILSDSNADRALSLLTENGTALGVVSTESIGTEVTESQVESDGTDASDASADVTETDSSVATQTEESSEPESETESISSTESSEGTKAESTESTKAESSESIKAESSEGTSQSAADEPAITPEAPWSWTL